VSNPKSETKRFRDHDLFAFLVSLGVTLVCAALVWLVVDRMI
jgi:hypothetical protein